MKTLPELELSVQMSGGEFSILEEFKFSSLNNIDWIFFKSKTGVRLSGAPSVDEA